VIACDSYYARVIRPVLVALLALIIFGVVSLVPAGSAGAAGLGDLPARAAGFLQQDFQTNGARNGDDGVGAIALYALDAAGVNTGSWNYGGVSLKDAVTALAIQDIKDPAAVPAKTLAQDLLAMQTIGRGDLADQLLNILQSMQQESGFDDNIYDNLSAFDLLARSGRLNRLNAAQAKDYLLTNESQGADGSGCGWGSYKWQGAMRPDIMATCEAVRALSALDPQQADAGVQAAIKSTLQLLQQQQQSDGSFVAGMDDPAIDTAEVMITLKQFGLQPDAWVSSSGKSAVDYLAEKALNADGSLGGSQNDMDATWVLEACATSSATPAAASPVVAAPTVPSAAATGTAAGSQAGAGGFTDIKGHWAEQEISLMTQRGYVSGVGDQLFAPDASVTRAQFAAFLVKCLGIALPTAQTPVFSDVPPSHWAYAFISAACQNGLISGVGDGLFDPDTNITREEMAVIVVNALKANGMEIGVTPDQMKALTDKYSDADQISGWAREAVAACINKGLFNGRSADQIDSRSFTSRAEAVVVLEQMLKCLGKLQ